MGPWDRARRHEEGWRGGDGVALKKLHDSLPESQPSSGKEKIPNSGAQQVALKAVTPRNRPSFVEPDFRECVTELRRSAEVPSRAVNTLRLRGKA
jgi:hypothetical protein